MIITTLMSFLGGNAFRMLFGEISTWITAKREHGFELDRIQLQETVDAAQHARNLESQRLQAELGVQIIHVQAESAVSQVEVDGWLEAVKSTTRTVGIAWVDAWNAMIRPGVATWSIAMITCEAAGAIALSDNTLAICGAALGIYIADRQLMKRSK